jgi:hypothetical protein
MIKFFIRKRKLLGIIFTIFIILNLLFFFIFPPIIKTIAIQKLSKQLNRKITINNVLINPYKFMIKLQDIFIYEPKSPTVFFHCNDIALNLNLFSLFRLSPIVSELKINRPYFHIVREKNFLYNFSDILMKKSSSNKTLFHFLIADISIKNGRIFFKDIPKKKKDVVKNINLSLPFISNFPLFVNRYLTPSFSADINGSPFTLKGKTKPFSNIIKTYFNITIKKLNLQEYITYVPVPLNFRLSSGYLSGNIQISFSQSVREKPLLIVSGGLFLNNLKITSLNKSPLLEVPQFYMGISSLNPFSKHIYLSRVKIVSPKIMLVKEPNGILNTNIFFPVNNKIQKKEKTISPFIFGIGNINISNGTIFFTDKSLKIPFNTQIQKINLNITNLSNQKGKTAQMNFSSQTNSKETFNINGAVCLNPLNLQGNFNIGKLILTKYYPYYANNILFHIADGQIFLTGKYAYSITTKNHTFAFSNVLLAIKGLKLKTNNGNTFLVMPDMNVFNANINMINKNIMIENCTLKNIIFKSFRLKNGKFNFLPLIPTTSNKKIPQKTQNTKKWTIAVNNIGLNKCSLHITDNVPKTPANINVDNLSIKISNLKPDTNTKSLISCSFLLNGKGTVSANGYFTEKPLSSILQINTGNLSIMSLQPYLAEHLNIIITDGTFSSRGMLTFLTLKNKKPSIIYAGNASINNFNSINKHYGNQFLAWKNLSLKQMNIGINPNHTSVEEASLKNLYLNVVVYPNKKINLLTIEKVNKTVGKSISSLPKTTTAKSQEQTYIGKIIVQNGHIKFLDRSIEPNYSMNLRNFNGNISGLSSYKTKPADVNFNVDLSGNSKLSINGQIQPLVKNIYLNMNLKLHELDLVPESTYTEKYLGYMTRKGKLTLNLKYLIKNKNLKSQNIIRFNQFTLGKSVYSPSATKLPVKFAIALLTDPSGNINLNFPVSGSLTNPKFRVGPIIIQILENLIIKAATSPFSLLGAIFGGGEKLSYINFDYGSSIISPNSQKKINSIVKILKNRPALNIEIKGYADSIQDTEALKNIIFMDKVKMQKLKEMLNKGAKNISINNISLTPEEYKKYLWLAYKNEKFPKQRKFFIFVKKLPDSEMKKLIIEHIIITNNNLHLLAMDRAEIVKDNLLKSGIKANRIFLLEPQIVKMKKYNNGEKASHVEFRLK